MADYKPTGRPRGPAPKVAEQRALEGGVGRQSVVSHRKTGSVVMLAPRIEKDQLPLPPDYLPQEGKDLWATVMPWLVSTNVVQLVDLPAIEEMCEHWAAAKRFRRVLNEQGSFTLGSMGQMIVHPAKNAYDNSSRMFMLFAEQFGLTTMARTRLGLMEVQRKSIQQDMDWTLGPSTRDAGE